MNRVCDLGLSQGATPSSQAMDIFHTKSERSTRAMQLAPNETKSRYRGLVMREQTPHN